MSGPVDDRLVRLATASNPHQAAPWQQAIEAEGTSCKAVGEALGSFGVVHPGSARPEVRVFQTGAGRARAVLQDAQRPG